MTVVVVLVDPMDNCILVVVKSGSGEHDGGDSGVVAVVIGNLDDNGNVIGSYML